MSTYVVGFIMGAICAGLSATLLWWTFHLHHERLEPLPEWPPRLGAQIRSALEEQHKIPAPGSTQPDEWDAPRRGGLERS